jgi:sugar lactone lactonase YvrE
MIVWGYSQGAPFQQPRGLAFDPRDGAIYVSNTGAHRLEVFSATGRPLSRIVHRVTRRDGEVVDGSPVALAFDRAGHLLVVDQLAPYVDVLDLHWRMVARLHVPAGQPSAVAVGGDGTIYVGTAGDTSKVHRFRPNYEPDGSWGNEGTAPGMLRGVAALATLGDSAVVVACERTDLAIQIFTPAGEYRRGFGTHEVGEGTFSLPSGLAITADGRMWVVDEIRRTLQVFDAGGQFLAKLNGEGSDTGGFMHPTSLATNGRSLVALTDRGINRVQIFSVPDSTSP